jgi:hypothetical protein
MLYRFFAASDDDCSETVTLALVDAENDEKAFAAGCATLPDAGQGPAGQHFGHNPADTDAFYSVEALDDAARIENALCDMPALAGLHHRATLLAAVLANTLGAAKL